MIKKLNVDYKTNLGNLEAWNGEPLIYFRLKSDLDYLALTDTTNQIPTNQSSNNTVVTYLVNINNYYIRNIMANY